MTQQYVQHLVDEQATVSFGNQLAGLLTQGATIYMYGDLGAGKTTLTRGIVQGFGHTGKVKSPTYTLVEPYELESINVYHFDLYRLADPEELEFMGIRDYFDNNSVCIIEWPSKGEGVIPRADIEITLEYKNESRDVTVKAISERAKAVVTKLIGNA